MHRRQAMREIYEHIEAIIPSGDMRNLLMASGAQLSDSEMAAIIFNHRILMFRESKGMLEMLMSETNDSILRDEIRERLSIQQEHGELEYWYMDDKAFSNRRFENRYVTIPYPFDRGDCVRNLIDGGIYKVMTSQNDWETINRRAVLNGYADYTDVSVRIVPIAEYGGDIDENLMYHEHVNPIYLDIFQRPLYSTHRS